jgi:hypothetical protein
MTFEAPAVLVPANLMFALNARRKFVVAQRHGSGRHKFLKAEDDLLRELVELYGETNWTTISRYMHRRTARQCRERYKNYLSPRVRNRGWTPEEEELLAQKVRELGPRWAKIACYFEARSDVSVKNRWAAMVSRNERVQKYALAKAQEGQPAPRGPPGATNPDDKPHEKQGKEEWGWSNEQTMPTAEEEYNTTYFE